jgi:hypothetical protein
MFVILSGVGGDVVTVRPEGVHHCAICEQNQHFSLVLRYEYFHIYYLFALTISRHYYFTCDVCQHGDEALDRRDIERSLKRIPIPFLHRYGWLVCTLTSIFAFAIMVGLLRLVRK